MGDIGATSGANISASASRKAAKRATAVAREALAENQRQFNLARGDQLPFIQAGHRAIPQYEEGIGLAPDAPDIAGFDLDLEALQQTPGYQFAVGEGERQLDRLSGVNRQLTSGNRLTAALEYGQGLGSQLYNQEYGRGLNKLVGQYDADRGRYLDSQNMLASLMGISQAGASSLGVLGQQSAALNTSLSNRIGGLQAAGALAQGRGGSALANLGGGILDRFGGDLYDSVASGIGSLGSAAGSYFGIGSGAAGAGVGSAASSAAGSIPAVGSAATAAAVL